MIGAPLIHRIVPVSRFIFAPSLLLLLVLVILYHWFQFPALPSNDDALFLSRGIGHFSVIEFSPHFPGYVGLVLFVKSLRLFFASDYQALHIVVMTMTGMIPIVVFFILNTLHVGRFISLAVAAMLYVQPLLISVALSGLSDGPGLLVWLLAVLFLLRAQPALSALLSGVMMTVRPSYLLLLLPSIGFLLLHYRHRFKPLLILTALPLLLSFIYMYYKDGLALFEEALRFVRGHFIVWGNTSLNDGDRASWWGIVSGYLGGDFRLVFLCILLLISCCVVWIKQKAAHVLIASFVSVLLWTLLFQNPDNLRHFLPVLVLSIMIISLMVKPFEGLFSKLSVVLSLLLIAYSLLHTHQLRLAPPAIHQALSWINTQSLEGRYERVIITNEGVEVAKEYQARRRVADAWYQQQTAWLWAGGAWRMSYNPIKGHGEPVAVFPRRFAGEHETYVYRFSPNAEGKQ